MCIDAPLFINNLAASGELPNAVELENSKEKLPL